MTVWPNGSKSKPYVSSSFGPRRAPIAGASTYHRGTDFSHTFSIIRAVASGQVKVAGRPSGWSGGGTQVWVQHDGFFTRSLHASTVLVNVGQFVREGDPLCIMGRTGTATDTHLHFELAPGNLHYSNTGQVDPVPFISSRLGSLAGGASVPTPAPVPEEDEDMPKLIRWRNLHVFSVAQEAILYVDTMKEKGTLEALHGRDVQDVDNAGIEAALNERGIHWDALDAVLRKVGPGTGGRYWSRLMAEGIAIRGEQAEQAKTLDDVLATAKAIETEV